MPTPRCRSWRAPSPRPNRSTIYAGGLLRRPPSTPIGPIAFGENGEWTTARIICLQFQGVTGGDLAQFQDWKRQVVVYPPEYKAGALVYPFEKAE
jgi:hypothetical protein